MIRRRETGNIQIKEKNLKLFKVRAAGSCIHWRRIWHRGGERVSNETRRDRFSNGERRGERERERESGTEKRQKSRNKKYLYTESDVSLFKKKKEMSLEYQRIYLCRKVCGGLTLTFKWVNINCILSNQLSEQ